MNVSEHPLSFLQPFTWSHGLLVLVLLVSCPLLILAVRKIVRHAASSVPSHQRLLILRMAPIVRLVIWVTGIALIVPLLVAPRLEDVIALLATISLTLAFALKDYVSCVFAGVVTIVENTYQPGDWIEVDGSYGEVITIGTRAVHIVTADDTAVIIPHSKLWSASVFNASSGSHSLLCVTNFYLHANHDGAAVRQALTEIAENCRYRKPESSIKVVAAETPWGTCYKIKAYVADSREQFTMMTDLTIRGKERLRTMGVAFAQAPYAEHASDSSTLNA